jgi:hypothetical protein
LWWLLIVTEGPPEKLTAFDHVGVERALGEELRALDPVGVFLEHVDEQFADDLALCLGVADAFQFTEEKLAFIGVDQRDVVVVAEHAHDLVGLVLPQKPVIDEDAGQLIADRLVDQDGGDGAVDTARQAADHLRVAHLIADLADRLVAVGAHGPVALEPARRTKFS